ncbi:MAG TPA: alpha/beta hydrolase [Aestuariivirgaceae bacterium]|jgi:haloacetate dehalogenase
MSDLFPGFGERRLATRQAEIFLRIGGSGPPLLLLHGFPQTHSMWHKLAAELCGCFTLVIPDLRGYGLSSCPSNDESNRVYSKRAMGEDFFEIMTSLGYAKFAVAGHDRGGRVAYRMALDSPQRVAALVVLDIVPTLHMWHSFDAGFAMKTYHWLFLAQPNPLPEMLIERAPIAFLDYTLASWTKTKNLSAFDEAALAEYRFHFATPEHVHATCNDYRAGWTYDHKADEADRSLGRRIESPTLAIWGDDGFPSAVEGTLDPWKSWCTDVRGNSVDSGHFVAEENPKDTLDQLMPFLLEYAVE